MTSEFGGSNLGGRARAAGAALALVVSLVAALLGGVASPVAAQDAPAALTSTQCAEWPDQDWTVDALPAGVDAAALDALVAEAFAVENGSQSVVILQKGRPVYERYAPGADADTRFPSFSVGKSFTSTLVGMLVDEGRLALDDPAPVPEWSDPADPRHEITLRDLLHMASGLQWNEGFGDNGDYGPFFAAAGSGSAGAYMAAKELEVEPGTRFEYSTGTSALIARIIADEVGYGDDYRRFLDERLTQPLGLDQPDWQFDESGSFVGGLGTDMNTRSFARFGLLYLRNGSWNGEQLVSSDWVDFVRTPSPSAAFYGGHFWLAPGQFRALGFAGQEVAIIPGQDLVIAVNSTSSQSLATADVAQLFAGVPSDPNDPADPACTTAPSVGYAVAGGKVVTAFSIDADSDKSSPANKLVLGHLPSKRSFEVTDFTRITRRGPRLILRARATFEGRPGYKMQLWMLEERDDRPARLRAVVRNRHGRVIMRVNARLTAGEYLLAPAP